MGCALEGEAGRKRVPQRLKMVKRNRRSLHSAALRSRWQICYDAGNDFPWKQNHCI